MPPVNSTNRLSSNTRQLGLATGKPPVQLTERHTLKAFDMVMNDIRSISGIDDTETNILVSTGNLRGFAGMRQSLRAQDA